MQPKMNQPSIQGDSKDTLTTPSPEQQIAKTNAEAKQNFPWTQLITAESGLQYPTALPPTSEARVPLRLEDTNLILKQANVSALSNEEFALIRRDGFGGSDSSVLLGVNPFTSKHEMLDQKARTTLTQEEMETGEQTAVIKGNDLEPLIIQKFAKTFNLDVLKPTDMYTFREYPYLTMNFDGIIDAGNKYFPAEIKVVTKKGERHYDPTKVVYSEHYGLQALPQNYSITNNSWETKAALYGIPPYYYTQLQAEIFAADAPFGFLATLWEASWKLHVYFVWADPACQNALIVEGFKAWQQVERMRKERGLPMRFT